MPAFATVLKELRKANHLTQTALAVQLGISKSAVSMYECGAREPDLHTLQRLAGLFHVDMNALLGHPGNCVPLLGRIACGSPLLAEENIQEYTPLPPGVQADYCLRCQGDSMTGARIYDGDTVFIKKQPAFENGDIAAVLIGEEATLKRAYRQGDKLTLMPENSKYPPLVYERHELDSIQILGKAVAFFSIMD